MSAITESSQGIRSFSELRIVARDCPIPFAHMHSFVEQPSPTDIVAVSVNIRFHSRRPSITVDQGLDCWGLCRVWYGAYAGDFTLELLPSWTIPCANHLSIQIFNCRWQVLPNAVTHEQIITA